MHQHKIHISPQRNLILHNIKSVLTRWYVIWNMNTRRLSNQGAILSLYNALCRTEYLQVLNTDEPEKFYFFTASMCASALATLIWHRLTVFHFVSFLIIFLSIFSSEVHLPCHSPQCSALHSPSGNNLVTLFLLLILFYYYYFNVTDPFSSMQVCAWCSFYWLSDWQKLFKLFFFFFIRSEL